MRIKQQHEKKELNAKMESHEPCGEQMESRRVHYNEIIHYVTLVIINMNVLYAHVAPITLLSLSIWPRKKCHGLKIMLSEICMFFFVFFF